MKKIKVLRANRGFWNDLFDSNIEGVKFIRESIRQTEDISKHSRNFMWTVSQLKLLDYLGVYQTVIPHYDEVDAYFSYNRFVKSSKPYILAVENPTALVHYHPKRSRSYLGKYHLRKSWNDSNLKAVVCLSKACQSTMKYYYDIPENLPIYQIYPYVQDSINEDELEQKVNNNNINCLFISSQFYLKGGGEVIEAIERNKWYLNDKIEFNIITKLDQLDEQIKTKIGKMPNVKLWDFSFTKKQLNKFYKNANIFINLTRMDSFSLVTLEALHYGCAFISTDMYAIKEMVQDMYNGFTVKSPSMYWNQDNTLNENLSKEEKSNLSGPKIDEQIVDFLSEKLNIFIENPNILKEMQINSFNMANGEFSQKSIKDKWERIIDSL
ncbi:glycosyltransferase family 4 protein [Sellimonas catena]|uniref:Glycosyl transferase family 1 domain-containing protein n=1 Tax=Sellimonas catena TaxID=2994035 RepID=A0A9W6CCX0_9FIRM|nr:glycosyltransferase family 4 protein [Sellimonas catena]GLG89816.1 hypothetical protein Selli2_12430 [Sellimonas catena]